MPMTNTSTQGGLTVAAASSVLRLTYQISQDGDVETDILEVADLPRLSFWFRHTSNAAGAGVQVMPQFAVSDFVVGGAVVPEFLDLEPMNIVLPFDQAIRRFYPQPARFIRLRLRRVQGSGTQTVEIVLSATQ